MEEKEEMRQEKEDERHEYEKNNSGNWRLIYPCENIDRYAEYKEYIEQSKLSWESFTTGKRKPTNRDDNNSNNLTNQ